MIICPNCSHMNPEGASNCESCLTPLPIMIQCPQCGQSVQDDAAFCGNCGYNLKQNPAPNPEPLSTEVIEETAVIKGLDSEKTVPPPVTFPEVEVEAEEEEIEEFTQPFSVNKAEATQIQTQLAALLHVQTNQKIEIPLDLKVMHMGRPNDQIPPDLDVSSFPMRILSRESMQIFAKKMTVITI